MDARGLRPAEVVPASRKLGRKDAAALARRARLVVVAKGKSVKRFEPRGRASADVVEAMLGPTGNLRAPTLCVGETVLVGFSDQEYEAALT